MYITSHLYSNPYLNKNTNKSLTQACVNTSKSLTQACVNRYVSMFFLKDSYEGTFDNMSYNQLVKLHNAVTFQMLYYVVTLMKNYKIDQHGSSTTQQLEKH